MVASKCGRPRRRPASSCRGSPRRADPLDPVPGRGQRRRLRAFQGALAPSLGRRAWSRAPVRALRDLRALGGGAGCGADTHSQCSPASLFPSPEHPGVKGRVGRGPVPLPRGPPALGSAWAGAHCPAPVHWDTPASPPRPAGATRPHLRPVLPGAAGQRVGSTEQARAEMWPWPHGPVEAGDQNEAAREAELDGASLLGSVRSVPLTADHRGPAEQTQVWTSGLCLNQHPGHGAETRAAGEPGGAGGLDGGTETSGRMARRLPALSAGASGAGYQSRVPPAVGPRGLLLWRAGLPDGPLPPAAGGGGVQKCLSAHDFVSE